MKNYLLFIFLICSTFISAQNFTVDSINYTVTTGTNVSVTTTCISGSVTIPATVTFDSTTYDVKSIGVSAFQNCSTITSITLSSGITTIEGHAFRSCANLSSVSIPSSVTVIDINCFRACPNLVSVSIPEGVLTIASAAFRDCSGLTTVSIPSTTTSIGGLAFGGCPNLTTVTVDVVTPLSITSNVFSTVPFASATLHVPVGALANYQAALVWKDFNTITEDVVLSVEALDSIKNQWVVFVNQSENILEIKPLNNGILQEVNVFSMDGKNVLTSTRKRIDLSFMKNGLYVVKTTTNQGVFSTKIIKE